MKTHKPAKRCEKCNKVLPKPRLEQRLCTNCQIHSQTFIKEEIETHCVNCGSLIRQKPKTKFQYYCHTDCRNDLFQRTGYFKKAMQKHFKTNPDAREKARARAKAWHKAHRPIKPIRRCEICTSTVLKPNQSKFCSKPCIKIAQREYNLYYSTGGREKIKNKRTLSFKALRRIFA